MNSKLLVIIAVTVAVIVVAVVMMLRGGQQMLPGASEPAAVTEQTVAAAEAELFERSQNPVKDALPEANPFAAQTNPFENVYKNPFDR